jgi:hypothetical protein
MTSVTQVLTVGLFLTVTLVGLNSCGRLIKLKPAAVDACNVACDIADEIVVEQCGKVCERASAIERLPKELIPLCTLSCKVAVDLGEKKCSNACSAGLDKAFKKASE